MVKYPSIMSWPLIKSRNFPSVVVVFQINTRKIAKESQVWKTWNRKLTFGLNPDASLEKNLFTEDISHTVKMKYVWAEIKSYCLVSVSENSVIFGTLQREIQLNSEVSTVSLDNQPEKRIIVAYFNNL